MIQLPRRLGFFPFLIVIVLLFSCNQDDKGGKAAVSTDAGLASFNADSLLGAIKTLSADDFQGRRPFTAGETKTVGYLVDAAKGLGLEPGNGDKYTQDVPMVEISPAAPSTLQVNSAKGSTSFQNLTDFVCWTERPDTLNVLDKNDVVFAGFGIVAPEYNWNDYAGLNVKGKTVIVMVNDPGFYDSTLFKGHTMTYYGRWTYKYEEAARQGASACLIVHNTAAASYPFSVVQSSNGGVKLHLDTRNTPSYQLAVQGWVTEPTAIKLLAAAGKDITLFSAAKHKGFAGVPLDLKLSAAVHAKEVYNQSHNVIAKITGSKYPDEYVLMTAHWDHLGVGKPDEKGDSIYNGALDNASGTAAILQIARAFTKSAAKPERTVVFLWVTAEEQGLLGSAYYAQHPVYPLATTVANLNIDGINIVGPAKDITISGKGQSELEDYLADELQKNGRYVGAEDHPEAGHYFRSDHFSFARAGVPSLSIQDGVDIEGKGAAYGKQMHDDYTAHHYHQPSDEYSGSWDVRGGLQDAEVAYEMARRLAFGREWPQWKTGSEFKATRGKSASDRK